jgi:tetratricopeptide (TPR) repeat protein/DNA-binding CsgD family transcriptional regulator
LQRILLSLLSFGKAFFHTQLFLLVVSTIAAHDKSAISLAKMSKADTAKITTLIRQGKSLEKADPAQALQYFHQALTLAKSLDDKSLPEIHRSLGWLYISQSEYDSSLFYLRKVLGNVEQNGNPELVASSYRGIGQTYLRLAKFDSSRYFLSQGLTLATRANAYGVMAGIHNDFGNIYIEGNNYAKALEEYLISAKLYDSLLHDPIGYSTVLSNIGNIHLVLGNLDKALQYANQVRTLSQEINYLKGIAYGQKLIGRIYRKQGKPDSAVHEYKEALNNFLKSGDILNGCELESSLGNIYYDKKEYRTALTHLENGLKLARRIHVSIQAAYMYSSMGFSYYELKDLDKAIVYFDSSRNTAAKIHNAYLMMDAYEMLSKILKEKGNFKQALELHQKFSFLSDSLLRAENGKAVEEIQSKYENNQKQAQIELLQKDQRISRISTQALVTVLVLVFVAGGLLISRGQVKVRTARKLAETEKILSDQQKELLEAELKTKQLQQDQLKQELEFKNKELTTYTLNLIQKNEVLEELRTALEQQDKTIGQSSINNILQKLKYSTHLDKEWDGFKRYFEQVHTGFFDSLVAQYPELSAADLKLCALLKLNLETKEMASLLGISPDSVKVSRSRLRKKLNLEAEQNLTLFLTALR